MYSTRRLRPVWQCFQILLYVLMFLMQPDSSIYGWSFENLFSLRPQGSLCGLCNNKCQSWRMNKTVGNFSVRMPEKMEPKRNLSRREDFCNEDCTQLILVFVKNLVRKQGNNAAWWAIIECINCKTAHFHVSSLSHCLLLFYTKG